MTPGFAVLLVLVAVVVVIGLAGLLARGLRGRGSSPGRGPETGRAVLGQIARRRSHHDGSSS